jgi:hypothetical protein
MGRLRGAVVFIAIIGSCGLGGPVRGQGALDNGPTPGSQQTEKHDSFSRGHADSSRGSSQDHFVRGQGQIPAAPLRSALHFRAVPASVSGVTMGQQYWLGGYPLAYGPYADFSSYYPYALSTGSGYFGPYVAPPIVVSGDAQFGPQAVQRFMGVDPVPRPGAQIIPRPRPPIDTAAEPPAVPRADNRARLKAWRLIDAGDAEFIARRFAQALSRYREAAAAARDLAEAQFRQGFALVATARYADAAKAFIRGLQLDPDWPDSDFRLDEIYGENKVVKEAHLDALQKAVAAHPHDPDLLFVLGVYLYFDGQARAAAPLFRRAEIVVGAADADHLAGFLKNLPPEKKPQPRPAMEPPAKNVAPDNAEPNNPPQRIPPPPLPTEDNPAEKPPADQSADPFQIFDITPPWAPRRPPW